MEITKQQATATSGADKQEQKKSTQNAGSLQDDAATRDSEHSGTMGDTGSESSPKTPFPGRLRCETKQNAKHFRQIPRYASWCGPGPLCF